jgi:monoamine oxidase
VIVAVPPALIRGIDFDPPLPPQRHALLQRLPHGSVVKANVVYDEPFWRRQGLSGQAASEDRTVSMVFDNSPADGGPGSWSASSRATRRWRSGRWSPPTAAPRCWAT